MLAAFIVSLLAGSLSTALLLWRKSVVEKSLAESRATEKLATEAARRSQEELGLRAKAYEDQLSRQRDQLETLRKQRDQAIETLATSGKPGSITDLIRMRTQG